MSPPTDVNDLFHLLGNVTRSRIMQALWDHFDFPSYVTDEQDELRFGELRERAAVDDSGNFNYHLSELVDSLVAETGSGYVLTPLGYNLMRAIERLESFEYTTRDPWTVEEACPGCGGVLTASYRREMLEVRCEDCGGLGGDGNFTFVQLSTTDARTLDARELLDAATLTMSARLRAATHGICWRCSSTVSIDLQRCSTHSPDDSGVCPTCSNRFQATVGVSCSTCGTDGFGPALEFAIVNPPVPSWFQSHGRGPTDQGPWAYRIDAMATARDWVEADGNARIAFDRIGPEKQIRISDDARGIDVTTEPAPSS